MIDILNYGRDTVNERWIFSPCNLVSRLYYVHSGTAMIYNSKKKHELKANHLYMFAQCNDFQTIDSKNFDHTYFDFLISPPLDSNGFLDIKNPPEIIMEILKCTTLAAENHKLSFQLLFQALMEYIKENYQIPFINHNVVNAAIQLISKNYHNCTVKKVAQELNMNTSYFIRLFKTHTGLTPMQYIKSTRIANAIHLLRNGYTIEEAAYKVGYSNASALCKAIKKEMNMTPLESKEFGVLIKNKPYK